MYFLKQEPDFKQRWRAEEKRLQKESLGPGFTSPLGDGESSRGMGSSDRLHLH